MQVGSNAWPDSPPCEPGTSDCRTSQAKLEDLSMLVTFQSEVGRITMFGDVAVQLLRMLGRSGKIPSALLASDIPEALTQLERAIETQENAQSADEDDEERNRPVTLRQRAIPLIDLLRHAAREKSDVMWEQAGKGPLQF